MSQRLGSIALLLVLLGCGRSRNQQASAHPVGPAPVTQAQDSNPVPNSQPVPAPAVRPSALNRKSSPAHEARPTATPAATRPTAPRRQDLQPPSAAASPADVGEQRPSPYPTFTIPAGTGIQVRLAQTLDTRHVRPGDRFSATLDAPLMVRGRVVVPKGTVFEGHVTEAKASGRLRGRGALGMTLDSFTLQGATYRVQTSARVRSSSAHKRRNLAFIGGGSGLGAAIGAIAGGGLGAVIGAGAGAAAGTTGALITGKRNVKLPVETPLVFSLRQNVDVKS